MNGTLCALIGFCLLIFCETKYTRVQIIIAFGVSLFGFLLSLHSFESEKKTGNKIFKIIEMMLCSFDIVACILIFLFDIN